MVKVVRMIFIFTIVDKTKPVEVSVSLLTIILNI